MSVSSKMDMEIEDMDTFDWARILSLLKVLYTVYQLEKNDMRKREVIILYRKLRKYLLENNLTHEEFITEME